MAKKKEPTHIDRNTGVSVVDRYGADAFVIKFDNSTEALGTAAWLCNKKSRGGAIAHDLELSDGDTVITIWTDHDKARFIEVIKDSHPKIFDEIDGRRERLAIQLESKAWTSRTSGGNGERQPSR